MEIITFENPILRQKAAQIETFDDSLKDLAAKMFSIMYNNDGVGLAAPQIGISISMFIMDSKEINEKRVVINPMILQSHGEKVSMVEGCLSIPNIYLAIDRPETVIVGYQDLSGKIIKEELSGLQQRIFQHETDHLNGILFTDRI